MFTAYCVSRGIRYCVSIILPHDFIDIRAFATMFYLPPLRRLLLPAVVLLTLIIFYRSSLRVPTSLPSFVLHPPTPAAEGIRVSIAGLQSQPLPIANASNNHLSPPNKYYYTYNTEGSSSNNTAVTSLLLPILNPHLELLFKCPMQANRYTSHIRLPSIVQNVSNVAAGATKPDTRVFWNPTIISLPYWSENQYLIVSRIVTNGNFQENVLCEANVCYTGSGENARPGEKPCTADDLIHTGPAGGMRCTSTPMTLSVPPTPAEKCTGKFGSYVDIPGFHDPRIFWSGKGEPLMMVNTQYVRCSLFENVLTHFEVPLCLLWSVDHRPPQPLLTAPKTAFIFTYPPFSRPSKVLSHPHRVDSESR